MDKGKIPWRSEISWSIPHLLMSDLKVTMLIDVETVCKTWGKVTLTLVFIMFHGETLQGNMATLQTECLCDPFATVYHRIFQFPGDCGERQKPTREMRSRQRYRFTTTRESTGASHRELPHTVCVKTRWVGAQ